MKIKELPKSEVQKNDWGGDTKMYELSEPVMTKPTVEDHEGCYTQHILVSCVKFDHGDGEEQQSYIFPVSEEGHPKDMVHLQGSLDGTMDHDKAIEGFLAWHDDNYYGAVKHHKE